MKKKFLVSIECFMPSSGGIVAMHKLCNDIKALDREAYVTSRESHHKLNAPFIGGKEMNTDEWVVIYPEIVHGNPFKFKHVARWILNTPGKCAGVGKGYYDKKLNTDLVFKYSPFFEYEDKIDGHMRCTFIDYEMFKNTNQIRDIESMFFVKKGGMNNKHHPDDSIDFSRFDSNWAIAAQMLNRCKYFYCYDNECFWVTLAALCGCITIVIPNTNTPSSLWKEYFPFNKYGIAFGVDEKQWAIDTISNVKDHCVDVQKQDLQTVANFINICDNL
jgi:hypothetical protein